MNQRELLGFFVPQMIGNKVYNEGETVEFSLANNSPFGNEAYLRSCHCVGEVKLETRTLSGNFKVARNGNPVEIYRLGDRYCQLFVGKGDEQQFFDLDTKQRVAEYDQIDEVISGQFFNQTLTLLLDDGKPNQVISPNGELTDNPDKSRVYIPVQYWIIPKNPS